MSKIIMDFLLPKIWFPFSSKLKATLMIHSPNKFWGTYEGLDIGCRYIIRFNKIETRMLEGNYHPKCREYNLDSEHEYNFRKDCIYSCYYKYLGANCFTTLKTTSGSVRKKSFQNLKREEDNCTISRKTNQYLRRMCDIKCPQECQQSIYNYKIVLDFDFRQDRKTFIQSDGIIKLKFYPNDQLNMLIEYMAETTFISFVCNFGGLLGMWLGVSILSISHDLFEKTKAIFVKFNFNNIKIIFSNCKIRNPHNIRQLH